jgi:pilus assembly protein CpaF
MVVASAGGAPFPAWRRHPPVPRRPPPLRPVPRANIRQCPDQPPRRAGASAGKPTMAPAQPRQNTEASVSSKQSVEEAKLKIQPLVVDRIDIGAAARLDREELGRQIGELVGEILREERIRLNQREQKDLVELLLDDMLGLGPLEPMLADETVTDIMVNGPYQVYVERKGKLEITDVKFRDNGHVMNICSRIVSQVGRRVDESQPLCDARLLDGSRVNIIIPPLAIDGPSISIRKFSKKGITIDIMSKQRNLSEKMGTVLKIAARSRLNILISGGTGSGKTTLLNAMSQLIDQGERICTIEDAAELQLQQPHVVRLETRPPNLEGVGEITMRDLVKNTLRMRPDRIILGESADLRRSTCSRP